jgi:hypothetical protein
MWRDIRPSEFQYLSTSIPRGSEEDFIDFMRYAAREQKGETRDNAHMRMRLSLATHNIQRIEATFEKLTETLLEDGHTQTEINNLYRACVDTGERFGGQILKIGLLIHHHDDIRDIFTPACQDGVLITPKTCKAIMLTAPTVYEPSGEKSVLLTPNQTNIQIPLHKRKGDFSAFDLDDSLTVRTNYRQTMIEPIKISGWKEYELPDKVENSVLKLGREAASIGALIDDLSEFTSAVKVIMKPLSAKERYLTVAADVFRERQKYTEQQLTQAKNLLEEGTLTAVETEKIQFYTLLTETYLAEMDFLADQIEAHLPIETISAIATSFRQIGRKQVSELPQIIEELVKIGQKIHMESNNEINPSVTKAKLFQTFEQPFGFNDLKEGNLPAWFKNLVSAYTRKKR